MTPRTKRILMISAFVLSVVGIGAALYFLFLAPAAPEEGPEPTRPGAEEPVGALPGSPEAGERELEAPGETELEEADEVARGGVTQVTTLTTGEVEGNTIATDGQNAAYYDPNDGRFYRIDDEGEVSQLSAQRFPNAENIEWDRNDEKALIEFPDGSNVVYDFTTQRQVTLPQHWEEFAFSPARDEIVAKSLAVDPGNRWLVTSSSDGSNVKAVQALGENERKVQVAPSPNDQVIAFSDTAPPVSGGTDRKMILPLGKEGQNIKGLVVEGFDFTPNWSPDGKKLLYSVAGDISQNKPMLWISDATPTKMGENRQSLGLNTWADKCAFASTSAVYCAVPQFLPANVGLQRALAQDAPDSLYKVDLNTGRSTRVAVPETETTMESLRVTDDSSRIYYKNRQTGALESIRLR